MFRPETNPAAGQVGSAAARPDRSGETMVEPVRVLSPLRAEADVAEAIAHDQVRLWWETTPVDLFLAAGRFHAGFHALSKVLGRDRRGKLSP